MMRLGHEVRPYQNSFLMGVLLEVGDKNGNGFLMRYKLYEEVRRL